jgi:hypothetical protein
VLFAILALVIFLGGALYVPWSFDATTYRFPRILYWWAHNSWYWTNACDARLDYSSTGYEWQLLPLMLLTGSDRCFFLINWIPFIFMPALLLRFFRIFRMNRAVTGILIWVVPSGYCYALQAGGAQNDGYAVFYLLSAFVFLDDYRLRGQKTDLIISMVAVGLLTGAKLSNLFLTLPYGIMFIFVLWHRRKDYITVLAATIPGLLASFVPLMILSYIYTGDITGDPHNALNVHAKHKLPVFCANTVLMAVDFTAPPITVGVKPILTRFTTWFNHTSFSQWMSAGHPNYDGIHYGEIAYEGGAGLGSGVALILILLALVRIGGKTLASSAYPNSLFPLMALTNWCAFLATLCLLASNAMARTDAPYYPLLIALLPWMADGKTQIPRLRLVSGVSYVVLAVTIFLFLMAPIRPVFPVLTTLNYLANVRHINAARPILANYEFWARLRDNLSEIRAALPSDAETVGFIGAYRDTTYGLWKPLGTRRVYEFSSPDPKDLERDHGVHFAVVTQRGTEAKFGLSLEDWMHQYKVESIQVFQFYYTLDSKSAPNWGRWALVTWK